MLKLQMEGHIFGLGIRILCFLCLCFLPVNRISYTVIRIHWNLYMTIFCECSSTHVKLWDIFSPARVPAKKKYTSHARKYKWCGCVPSSTSAIDKVDLICVWQWSKFNWQDMSGMVQVQLTRCFCCVCSSVPPSGDKICLLWSKFNWQDISGVPAQLTRCFWYFLAGNAYVLAVNALTAIQID